MDEAQKQAMAEAVARIRENMTAAAKAAGRDPGEVLLCAACKTRTVEEVRYSADLPIDLFGENHVQELVEKTDAGAYNGKPGHFIGHLQTNKVNKVVGRAALIMAIVEALMGKTGVGIGAPAVTGEMLENRFDARIQHFGNDGSDVFRGRFGVAAESAAVDIIGGLSNIADGRKVYVDAERL